MKRFTTFFGVIIGLALFFSLAQNAEAADWCVTGKDLCSAKTEQTKCVGSTFKTDTECWDALKKAAAAADAASTNTSPAYTGPECDAICKWIVENYDRPDYKGPIPQCAFTGQCREANDLVQFFIQQGRGIMGMIGMLALGAFVYGGLLMVFSFGSSDKVSQGKEVMVAAVVGIIIVFSAYIGVAFLLKSVGVNEELRAIK